MKKPHYWELLASPVKHHTLVLRTDGNALIDSRDGEEYPIVGEIPVMLPPGFVADWANNVLEVLFVDEAMKITRQTIEEYGPEGFQEAMQKYIQRKLGTSGVKTAFDSYGQLPESERCRCFLFAWAQSQSWAGDLIDSGTLTRGESHKTIEKGKQRFEGFLSFLNDTPGHFPKYTEGIFYDDPHIIVELGCGSGFGSCAVVSTLKRGQLFFPIDIDYACTANCIGIRRHLSMGDQVLPLVANFWFIPFPDSSIDVICSRFGIDETREVPRVLREAFRVLKNGSRIVIVAKSDPAKRFRYLIGDMDFSNAELREMASCAGLYAGEEMLLESANGCGFAVVEVKTHEAEDGEEQILCVLEKLQGSK